MAEAVESDVALRTAVARALYRHQTQAHVNPSFPAR